jgi:hypothetical protein
MGEYKMIVAAILGSTITLLITAAIDYFKEKHLSKLEKQKLVFQRKTDAAEKAMSWYQESADCLMMMQTACSDMGATFNPITWTKLMQSANQASQLYKETSLRLNPLYLYFDFRKIEEKYQIFVSAQFVNNTLVKIGIYEEQSKQLKQLGKDDNSKDIQDIKNNIIYLIHELSKALKNQIESITAIQEELRKQYKEY